jgi:hypothetical protein
MPAERRPGRRQRGQALAETLVVAIALVPLLFGLVFVGKVLDLRAAAQSAARGLAFECTVRPWACADAGAHAGLAADVRARHFGIDLGPLRSDAAGATVGRAPWHDRTGRPLLESAGDVAIAVRPVPFDSPLAFAGGTGAQAFPDSVRLLSDAAGPGRFGLDLSAGLFDARVTASVARSRSLDDWLARLTALPLSLRARVAVLTDAWNASGPYGADADSVETRVVAGARLPVIDPAIDAGWLATRGLLAVAGALGVEPSARRLAWHEVDVDLVPPDRLGAAYP